jgi:hypothetical protein
MPARIVCTVLFGSSCVLCFSIIKNVDEFYFNACCLDTVFALFGADLTCI